MRTLLILSLLLILPMAANAAVETILKPEDIERAPTTQAILTFNEGPRQNIKAMLFPHVPDQQACFNLAYKAAKGGRESSATCIDAQREVIGTYFCMPSGETEPYCQSVLPATR